MHTPLPCRADGGAVDTAPRGAALHHLSSSFDSSAFGCRCVFVPPTLLAPTCQPLSTGATLDMSTTGRLHLPRPVLAVGRE